MIDIHTLLYRAELAMKLGEVKRATEHPGGKVRETDTTHTVMLQLACLHVHESVGRELGLDLGVLLRHALVHDLPEALCGDVCTIRPLTPKERADKDRREADATGEIEDCDSALALYIDNYEYEKVVDYGEQTIEAEIVHVLDKLMPRLTHVLNAGAALDGRLGVGVDEIVEICSVQTEKLMDMHPQCAFLRPALDTLATMTFERMRDRIAGKAKAKSDAEAAILGGLKPGDGVRVIKSDFRQVSAGAVGIVECAMSNGRVKVDIFGQNGYGFLSEQLKKTQAIDHAGYPLSVGDAVRIEPGPQPFDGFEGRVGIINAVSVEDEAVSVDVIGVTQSQPFKFSRVSKVRPADLLEAVCPEEMPHGWGMYHSCSEEHDGASLIYSHPALGNDLIVSIADHRGEADSGGRQGWVLSMACGDPEVAEVIVYNDLKVNADGQVVRMVGEMMEEVES